MGIIYMGISPSGKKYIGQHNTEDFRVRHKRRMQAYKKYQQAKKELEKKKFLKRTKSLKN
jgi:hypothetical protein